MLHRFLISCVTVAFLFSTAPALGSATPKQPVAVGFDVLNNIELLPLLKDGVLCLQHSSYDRTGGNDDGFSGRFTHLRQTEAGEFVIFDAEGPGCIYRFWSAHPPEGYVKFYFDGETEPRITCNFREMFQDKVPPFASPLTGQSSGGWYSYHPIPFAKRCVIVSENKTGFLAIAYHKYPRGAKVETFTPALTPEQKRQYDAVQAHFADPSKKEIDAGLEMHATTVSAGDGEFELAKLRGPATILGLHMKLKTEMPEKWKDDHTLRKTVLRIYWDGNKEPAIESPLGDFFGTGFGDKQPSHPGRKAEPISYAAVPFGMTEDFYYFRLPMPFRKSARITIENGTGEELELGWALDVKKGRIPKNATYLHVQWRDHVTKTGEHVPILETTGRGHYVGTVLSMQSPHWLTYLEGDEKIYVDGEARPSIYGTGTEDYFNCGWYYNKGIVSKPFHGLTVKRDPQSRTSQYRMHVPDCIPFTKSLKVQIEHGEANDRPNTSYAIVAYWYQDSTSHEVLWQLPAAKNLRMPGWVVTNPGIGTFRPEQKWTIFTDLVPTLEVDGGMQVGGGTVAVVPYNQLDENYQGPPRLLASNDKPGAFVRWQAYAVRDDLYTLDLISPRGTQFGIARLFVDGEATEYTIDFYSHRTHQAFITGTTPFFMKAGMRWLELRVTDKNEKSEGYNMALGAYLVKPGGPWPKEWNVIGSFPGGHDYGYTAVYPPENGVDLQAEYTGAEDKKIAWRTLKAQDILWLHPHLKPSDNRTAYAHIYVKSPDERNATAFISADDAGKLFVNGTLLWALPGLHPIKLDQHQVAVKLNAGWNEVLIKVCQSGGNWGVAFRIQDPKSELVYATTKGPSQDENDD